MTGRIEVKVSELVGPALDWAVAIATIGEVLVYPHGGLVPPEGTVSLNEDDGTLWTNIGEFHYGSQWQPSTDWSQGGPLVQGYGVLLSPPESMVHRHGGPNAGWGQSGSWGATIFRVGAYRRQAHSHQTEPLVAAMRCIVGWALGEAIKVPKELMP